MARPIVICRDCGKEKPHKAKGLCKRCYNYRWQQANPEKMAANKALYREGHKEEIMAYDRRYRQGHQKEISARMRRWRKDHREEISTNDRHWRKDHQEKVNILYPACRRARKKGVANTATPENIEFERKIGEAKYPGEKLALHHSISFSKNGNHSWDNIMFIPASLNRSIGNKLPQEVYRQLALTLT